MQAALVKLALVDKLPFGPQMVAGAPTLLGGLEGGGFKGHLAQALAKLLGGPPPGTPLQEEEDGLPPAVSALRRALERAGSAGEAVVEDGVFAADGCSRLRREQILELSQVDGARINLAALFELAAATPPVAPEEADAPCPEAANTPSKAGRTERGIPGGTLAGLECNLSEERPQPEVQTPAAGAGAEARLQAETAAGVPPAAAQPFEEAAAVPAVEGQAPKLRAAPRSEVIIGQPEQPGQLAADLGLAGQPVVKDASDRREAGADLEVRADKFSAPGAIERSAPGPEPSPGPGPSPELVREVAHQVERAITAGLDRGEGRLRLRLKPPGLGELRLDLSLRGEHLKVVLVTESPAARDTLQAGLPELRHALAEQGLKLEQFNVFVRQEGGSLHHSLGRGQGTGGESLAAVSAAEGPETGAVLATGRLATGHVDLFC